MISAFMLYAIALSAVVSVAALLLDRALAAIGRPRRVVWLIALLLSATAPVLMQTNASELPPPIPVSTHSLALPRSSAEVVATPAITQPVSIQVKETRDFAWPSLPSLDTTLQTLWLTLSIATFLVYARAWLLLHRSRRAWRSQWIDGTNVLVSEDVGPAVVGFRRAQIVVPRWLIGAPRATRALALRHEAEHIAARDPLALLLSLLLIALMPWNVALWWQLRRLRFAIELDCDARVLRSGANAADYGEALLLVGQRHTGAPLGAVALIEPPSDLEKRIHTMMTNRPRYAALTAIGCAALCISLLTAAAQVNPPSNEERLVFPPPQTGFHPRVEGVVRARFPEVFDAKLDAPVLLNVLLDNALQIESASKTALAPGTTLDAASPPDAANNGFSPEQLHPADERFLGRLIYEDHPGSAPVFLNYAARGVHRTRSASVVEPVIRATLPELYDETPDGDVLVTAVFDANGTLKSAKQAPYKNEDSLDGRDNQLKRLAAAGTPLERISTTAVIPGSGSAPFKPTVLYAFEKSDDPFVETHPLSSESLEEAAVQRALVERYFPQVATESAQPHELLWVLLNEEGEVVRTGRSASNPEALSASIPNLAPGADVFVRRTKSVGELLGRDVLDVQRQPVLVSFLWGTFAGSEEGRSEADVIVDSNIYRNDKLVTSNPMSLRFGERWTEEVADELRVETSAVDIGENIVEFRMRLFARAQTKGVEFADPWEPAMEPRIHIRYGMEGTIELGVRYPENPEGTIWRIELKPRRAAG